MTGLQKRFDRLPVCTVGGGSVQYLQEITSTNAAAIVSESDLKPESNITYELKTATVATIAHFIRCSNQALADIPQLQSHIDGALRYGVAFAEELQLLKGSGVGNNLSGMMTDATAFTGSGATKIDKLRAAINQLALSDFSASGIVMHPTDWMELQLLKDTTGRYIVGDPSSSNPPVLWGLPVVPTAAMTVEDFLVGDFPAAALIFDREESRVDISTEDGDNFRTNRATLRGEERLALAILRPGALVKGEFGGS